MKKLAQRIQWLLASTGRKSVEAARAAGVDKGYISNLRSGKKSNPSEQVISALAKFFDCDPEWLRTGKGRRGRNRTLERMKQIIELNAIERQLKNREVEVILRFSNFEELRNAVLYTDCAWVGTIHPFDNDGNGTKDR